MPNQNYCDRLLDAEKESEVTAAIEDIEHAFDAEWVPIGRQQNNYGIVENQSSSPLGALTEIISNAADAVLRKRYRQLYGDEYDESHEIRNYSDAAEKLLVDGQEEISITADGQTPNRGNVMNLTVKDTGEGQTTETFEDTFVGLLKPGMSKQGWPFLQGQFGMGSTAVLPHCGEKGYKLICSAGMEDPGTWSWTIIRKNKAGNAYEYLRVDGDVPSFSGEFQGEKVGSFIKMYDYTYRAKSNIGKYLRYDLARVITRAPIPILLRETRYDNRSSRTSYGAVGLKTLIDRNSEYVKRRQTVTYDFGPPLGKRDVEMVVFKSDDEVKNDDDLKISDGKQAMFVSRRKQEERSIFFTVNDQVHGDLGLSFVKNRCDRYHTGKDLMAFVDFSDLGPAQLTDLFKPSRDRLTDKPMAQRLKEGMEDLIKNDPVIDEIEQARREQFTKEKREEKLGNMLEELVDRNPQLLEYLQDGNRIKKMDIKDENEDDYTAPHYPDVFKIITSKLGGEYEFWESDDRYKIEIPVNRNSWMRFYLNAANDFFTRQHEPGWVQVTPQEVVRSWGLSDGQLSMQLRPLPNVQPGTAFPVTVKVGANGMDPLEQQFTIHFAEEVEAKPKSGSDDVPPIESLEFPEIQTISRDQWDSHWAEWDEQTPVQIEGTESDDMTLWVNYDAGPLVEFMSRHNLRKTGKEAVKETWKAGVSIYTLSSYLELRNEFDEDDVDSREVAAVSIKGVTQSMLDQHISTEELESLTV